MASYVHGTESPALVDTSPPDTGVQAGPAGQAARLVEEDGVLVSAGVTPVDDDILFGLIDAGRE